MALEHMPCASGYGDLTVYADEHGDFPEQAEFDRLNRIASCMADFLAGRGLDPVSYLVREAVHWQIWFMRRKGSIEACFSAAPRKESFADYSVERDKNDGTVRLFGMEVCPMMLQILKTGGVITSWV